MKELSPCPQAGAGVHPWVMASANICRNNGIPAHEAERMITERMTRKPNPANEVRTTVEKAYREQLPAGRVAYHGRHSAPVPITEIAYDEAKLRRMADRITAPANWRHWLWERSAKRPEAMNPYAFLLHLYKPGERVLIFDRMDSKAPVATAVIESPMDCRTPEQLIAGGNGEGIWYLCNPVDGQWHDTGEKDKETGEPVLSCRNWQAVTSFRYAVLESDKAPAHLWLAFIAQLPLCIEAIYTSGSRSIHVLVRLDAPSKQAWDDTVKPLKRPLRHLGGDNGCLSAVRLTRLPGCARPEKGGFQRLLYLNPEAPEARLIDLPVRRTRTDTLTHWRAVCPLWNNGMEAFR
jgi:hypothetical protein